MGCEEDGLGRFLAFEEFLSRLERELCIRHGSIEIYHAGVLRKCRHNAPVGWDLTQRPVAEVQPLPARVCAGTRKGRGRTRTSRKRA